RDFHVTGVQTCALPIWRSPNSNFLFQSVFCPTNFCPVRQTKRPHLCRLSLLQVVNFENTLKQVKRLFAVCLYSCCLLILVLVLRSEERRVGKECGNDVA